MNRADAAKAAAIVRDAGGQIIGRTRLQKIAYLLTGTGLEDGFSFTYKHFGPYSEEFSKAAHYADLFGLLEETKKQAAWGGSYSIYSTNAELDLKVCRERLDLVKRAANADSVELELVATALFLAKENHARPWVETERRKPEKSEDGRLDRAKALYEQFRAIETPSALPAINE